MQPQPTRAANDRAGRAEDRAEWAMNEDGMVGRDGYSMAGKDGTVVEGR